MRGLSIPFTLMGCVSSVDLFEDREQTIFDFYERNAERYKNVADIGANIGIHACLMARIGWNVRAYEPDPEHYARLVENMTKNIEGRNHGEVQAFNAAVSTSFGKAEFVRVLNNGTASHIEGSRGFHGPVEMITVDTVDCRKLFEWVDFAKIDCEGLEAALLCAVPAEIPCEFLVEVGTAINAVDIFSHFYGKRSMWVQRGNEWAPVVNFTDMPTHYTHGALFIGKRP